MADVRTHHVKVNKTARYSMLGPGPGDGLGILFALHGYGQLAPYFIQKFAAIAESGWTVVAPEGGHRFYLKGTEGRVGASWMTREDRLTDIADLVSMLDEVHRDVLSLIAENATDEPKPVCPLVLLGFSQGVPAALRWAAMGHCSFDRIIGHSGVFPSDIPEGRDPKGGWPKVDLLIGDADPYITSRVGDFQVDLTDRSGIAHTVHTFKGGHDIDVHSVMALLEKAT